MLTNCKLLFFVVLFLFLNCDGYFYRHSHNILSLSRKRLISSKPIAAFSQASLIPQQKTLLEKINFSWLKNVIKTGAKRPLEIKDISILQNTTEIEDLSTKFKNIYQQQLLSNKVNSQWFPESISSPVAKSLFILFKDRFLLTALLRVLNVTIQFLPSIIISSILSIISFPYSQMESILLSFLLFISLSADSILESQYSDRMMKLGADIRGVLSNVIYLKSLVSRPNQRTQGEILNYLQIDTERIEAIASTIHSIWDGIFQIMGFTLLLFCFLGKSVVSGVAFLFGLIPVIVILLQQLSKSRDENVKYSDLRVKVTNEVFHGIRPLKSYNWEIPFYSKLRSIREQELQYFQKTSFYRAFLVTCLTTLPSLIAFITLTSYALQGNSIHPTIIFSSLALLNQLKAPLTTLPTLLSNLAEGKVSLQRLNNFLSSEEILSSSSRSSSALTTSPTLTNSPPFIQLENGTFSWNPREIPMNVSHELLSDYNTLLTNVSLSLKPGDLVAVIGPTGSGKSSLLYSILGELNQLDGNPLQINGKVAYVPQQAWLPQGTIRNAILFGKEMNSTLYRHAIHVSGLYQDLQLMPKGDFSEINDKGLTLSAGQKQRISLARAIYANADIYLLDDPLSAVDSQVSYQIFQRCIQSALTDKICLFVTHKLNLITGVDKILVMDIKQTPEGNHHFHVIDQGNLLDLLGRGYDFKQYLKEDDLSKISISSSTTTTTTTAKNSEEFISSTGSSSNSFAEEEERIIEIEKEEDIWTNKLISDGMITPYPSRPFSVMKSASISSFVSRKKMPMTAIDIDTKLENIQERPIPWQVYQRYLTESISKSFLFGIFLIYLLANSSQFIQQWIVTAWMNDTNYQKATLFQYLIGLGIMSLGEGIFSYLRSFLSSLFGVIVGKQIHHQMIRKILSAPLTYFETTPIGKLLLRFSKDLDQIDNQLSTSLGQILANSLQIFTSLIAIAWMTPSISFNLSIAMIFLLYSYFLQQYRIIAKELKKLDTSSRSSLYSHFAETLHGLSTIKSFHQHTYYQSLHHQSLNQQLSIHSILKSLDRWLLIRIDILSNLFVFATCLFNILSKQSATLIGFSVNNALMMTSLFNTMIRNVMETEQLMDSIEKAYKIIDETPQETSKPFENIREEESHKNNLHNQLNQKEKKKKIHEERIIHSDEELLASGWPWKGEIIFQNVTMKYRPDYPPVLHQLTMNIRPGEKIGIVGRTGTGKSSLFRGLLRLYDLENGSIFIDGVDVSKIGLDTLRSTISIISQDPLLFSGSIRVNIDPFQQYSDTQIWEALSESKLFNFIKSLPGELDYEVQENGNNFSIGQKQLLCLTRALLKRSKILLLDEATSAVDYQTDSMIQETINREFHSTQNTTILMITHRLSTVMNCDKVVVMERGIIKEFDTPTNLLQKKDSLFSQLVQAERNHHLPSIPTRPL